MKKQIHLNAFTQCSICHHSKGQWKNPADGSSLGYKNVDYWVDLAKTLERGGFAALFLADVHGTYNVYQGSRDTAVRHTVQFPSNDPTLIISAMAYATQRIGFACTYSTSYFAPYQAAKVFSTLDHLTRGRIAWNVVTSYLPDANENFEIGDQMSHDERYERAEEFISEASTLAEGDLVVHIEHGVGRYRGLINIDIEGVLCEFIHLEYADKAKLYVPVLLKCNFFGGIFPRFLSSS